MVSREMPIKRVTSAQATKKGIRDGRGEAGMLLEIIALFSRVSIFLSTSSIGSTSFARKKRRLFLPSHLLAV